MSRRCELTGKGVLTGNNVSHAHNKTRRRYVPNLQVTSIYSESLGEQVRLKVSMHALRSVEHGGGLDAYILGMSNEDMSPKIRRLRRRIEQVAKANIIPIVSTFSPSGVNVIRPSSGDQSDWQIASPT